jgi:glycerophosphoryl diester phosphodiesterase
MTRPTLACAHRGLSVEFPENTIAAFRAAADAGAHGIELDVRLSHDNQVVIMHDANLARTTDGPGRIGDIDLAEIQTHLTHDGAPVPTLDEAFDALSKWNGVWNIEIKENAATPGVLELMTKHGLTDRLMVSAMDPTALAIVHRDSPATPRGLIALGPPDEDDFEAIRETGGTWLMAHGECINEAFVKLAQAANLYVGAWTINDLARAQELAKLGVDMIITDERAVLESLI